MTVKDKILIVYFSWSGNTKEIAAQIYKLTGGDIFEIQRTEKYPDSYDAVLYVAKQEIHSNSKPVIKNIPASIEEYDTIFLGFPNWCNTFPAPILTFLSEFDFSGKKIIPFCTHGGGGIGKSVSNIINKCPNAEVLNAFSINGYAVQNSAMAIKKWLNKDLCQ